MEYEWIGICPRRSNWDIQRIRWPCLFEALWTKNACYSAGVSCKPNFCVAAACQAMDRSLSRIYNPLPLWLRFIDCLCRLVYHQLWAIWCWLQPIKDFDCCKRLRPFAHLSLTLPQRNQGYQNQFLDFKTSKYQHCKRYFRAKNLAGWGEDA